MLMTAVSLNKVATHSIRPLAKTHYRDLQKSASVDLVANSLESTKRNLLHIEHAHLARIWI